MKEPGQDSEHSLDEAGRHFVQELLRHHFQDHPDVDEREYEAA